MPKIIGLLTQVCTLEPVERCDKVGFDDQPYPCCFLQRHHSTKLTIMRVLKTHKNWQTKMQVVKEQCKEIPGQECNVVETEVCEQVPVYNKKIGYFQNLHSSFTN